MSIRKVVDVLMLISRSHASLLRTEYVKANAKANAKANPGWGWGWGGEANSRPDPRDHVTARA